MKEIYLDLRELAFDIDETVNADRDSNQAHLILELLKKSFKSSSMTLVEDSFGVYYAGEKNG